MSSDGRIVIYAGAGFVWGAFSFVRGLGAFRLKRLVENTPTSKVRAAAVGLVEVCGCAEPFAGRLASPFTREPCVYYRYTIEEHRRSGKSSRWVTVKTGEQRVRFYVKDETGSLLINPKEASVEIPLDNEYQSGCGRDPPEGVISFLSKNGMTHEGFLGWNKTMRFREYYIAPGDTIYVMGTADIRRRISSMSPGAGQGNLEMHKGTHDKTFYISDKSEKEVLSALDGRVLWGVFGGAALSLICLAVILGYFRVL